MFLIGYTTIKNIIHIIYFTYISFINFLIKQNANSKNFIRKIKLKLVLFLRLYNLNSKIMLYHIYYNITGNQS